MYKQLRNLPTHSSLFLFIRLFLILSTVAFYDSSLHAFRTNIGFIKPIRLYFAESHASLTQDQCSRRFAVRRQFGGRDYSLNKTLNVTLSGTGIQFFSDSACTQQITAADIPASSTQLVFWIKATDTGALTMTASGGTDQTIVLASHSFTSTANGFIWTGGGGDANWTTLSNWLGPLTEAPGVGANANKTAIFNGLCATLNPGNCNPVINTNLTFNNGAGIEMRSDFSGTISRSAGTSLTMNRFIQHGGTFQGGSTLMTLSGGTETAFHLSNGNFYSPSTLRLAGWFGGGTEFTITNPSSFNHNSGTLEIAETQNFQSVSINADGAVFYNIEGYQGSYVGSVDLKATTIYVTGTFSMTPPAGALGFNNGTVKVSGNISYNCTGTGRTDGTAVLELTGNPLGQTVSTSAVSTCLLPALRINAGTNNVTLSNANPIRTHWGIDIQSANTLTATGTTVHVSRGNIINNTAHSLNNLVLDTYDNVNTTYVVQGTMKLDGSLTVDTKNRLMYLDGDTIEVNGDITVVAQTSNGLYGGTGTVKVTGRAAGSTLTGTATGGQYFGHMIIDTPHPVTLVNRIGIFRSFRVLNAGTWTSTGSTLLLLNTPAAVYTFDPGGKTFHNIEMAGASGLSWYDLAGPLTATGTFTGTNSNARLDMNGFAVTFNTAINLGTGRIRKEGGVLTVNGVVQGTGSILGGTVDP